MSQQGYTYIPLWVYGGGGMGCRREVPSTLECCFSSSVCSAMTLKSMGRFLGCFQPEVQSCTRDLFGTTMLLLLCLNIELNLFLAVCVSFPSLCRGKVLLVLLCLVHHCFLERFFLRFCLVA